MVQLFSFPSALFCSKILEWTQDFFLKRSVPLKIAEYKTKSDDDDDETLIISADFANKNYTTIFFLFSATHALRKFLGLCC